VQLAALDLSRSKLLALAKRELVTFSTCKFSALLNAGCNSDDILDMEGMLVIDSHLEMLFRKLSAMSAGG
jgi:hypothetical protein